MPTAFTPLTNGAADPTNCAEAFIAGFRSPDTRRAYRRDLQCWLGLCMDHGVHPYAAVRRTHVEAYLLEPEQHVPPLANGTLRRRICTLSSWFTWLEDEDISVGNPAACVRRPRRHARPQPWLDRNELTDVLAAAEFESGSTYALVCLLGLNGLRISEACGADIADLEWLSRMWLVMPSSP